MQHCLKAFLIWTAWVTAYAGEEDGIGAQIVDIPQNDLFRSTFTNSSRSCFCFLMSAGSKSVKSLPSLLLKNGCPTESRTMIQDFLRQISEKLGKTTCCYVLRKLSGRKRNEYSVTECQCRLVVTAMKEKLHVHQSKPTGGAVIIGSLLEM